MAKSGNIVAIRPAMYLWELTTPEFSKYREGLRSPYLFTHRPFRFYGLLYLYYMSFPPSLARIKLHLLPNRFVFLTVVAHIKGWTVQ